MNSIHSTLALSFVLLSFAISAQECEVVRAPFNSEYADFSPTLYEDGVVFCSNRSKKVLTSDIDSVPNFYTDLYFVQAGSDKANLFSKSLTDFLNEGPAVFNSSFSKVYYTANIHPDNAEKKMKIKEYPLGIFSAFMRNGIWVKEGGFEHNAGKKGNVAHPAITPNDSALYFVSSLMDTYGGADLYASYLTDGGWSKPVNMGPEINSEFDELFPFVDANNQLYFTSNRHSQGADMDIFVTHETDSAWAEPTPLQVPINGPNDDFGLTIDPSGSFGYFSSNRDGNDDIYRFDFVYPEFADCGSNVQALRCFYIEDIALKRLGDLPLSYEWNLGDGNLKSGLQIEHCYDTPGTYTVSLTAVDTITQQVFMQLSKAVIEVHDVNQPFIQGADSLKLGSEGRFTADINDLTSFDVANWYWMIDGREQLSGEEITFQFDKIGTHEIALAGQSTVGPDGHADKVCVKKYVTVLDSTRNLAPAFDKDPVHIQMNSSDLLESLAAAEIQHSGYVVELLRSDYKIEIPKEVMVLVGEDIALHYDSLTQQYVYSLAPQDDLVKVYHNFQQIAEGTDWAPLVVNVDNEEYFAEQIEVISMPVDEDISLVEVPESIPTEEIVESELEPDPIQTTDVALKFDAEEDEIAEEISSEDNGSELVNTETLVSGDLPIEISVEELTVQLDAVQKELVEEESTPLEDVSTVLDIEAAENLLVEETPAAEEADQEGLISSESSVDSDVEQPIIQLENDQEEIAAGSSESTGEGIPTLVPEIIEEELSSADPIEKDFQPIVVESNPEVAMPDILETEQPSLAQASPLENYVVEPISDESPQELAYTIELTRGLDPLEMDTEFAQELGENIIHSIDPMTNEHVYRLAPRTDAQIVHQRVQEITLKHDLEPIVFLAIENDVMPEEIICYRSKESIKWTAWFNGLDPILFDYNSKEILPESNGSLDYISAMMQLEEGFVLYVDAHTCDIGGQLYNMNLSRARGHEVRNYLIAKGIDSKRIEVAGWGFGKPINDNENEAQRSQNRRVEFTVSFEH